MAHFEEHTEQPYDWGAEGVYVIECDDPVEGGADGVSNRQAAELTRRTRNLHQRLTEAEGEIDTIEEHTPIAIEAAKRSAIEHTEATAAAVRDELALGDQAAVRSAKAYADQIVAALVDGSPELLNTLEELAAALGGDPNFATTVMTAIGERVKTTDFTESLQSLGGKVCNSGALIHNVDYNEVTASGVYSVETANAPDTALNYPGLRNDYGNLIVFEGLAFRTQFYTSHASGDLFWRVAYSDRWSVWRRLLHSGNSLAITSEEKAAWNGKAAGDHAHVGMMTTTTSYGLTNPNVVHSTGGFYPSANKPALYCMGFCMNTYGTGAIQLLAEMFHGKRYWLRANTNEGGGEWSDWTEIYTNHNLKIIRGSVTANGTNGGGNASEVGNVYGEPAVVRVTHNLGTTAYSATASAVSNTVEVHSDNVVTVWRKAANYTDFVVTEGPGNGRELCAFDYMIIPY